jgi:transposase
MSEPALAPTAAPSTPRPRAATRQAWVQRLQRFADAGLTPAQFCAAEGVSLPSFYAWKRRLTAAAAEPARAVPDEPGPRLLPVRLPDPRAAFELALPSGAILRVAAGADEATLRCLLRLLGVPPC